MITIPFFVYTSLFLLAISLLEVLVRGERGGKRKVTPAVSNQEGAKKKMSLTYTCLLTLLLSRSSVSKYEAWQKRSLDLQGMAKIEN